MVRECQGGQRAFCFEREREVNFIVLCCMPTLSHQSRATNYCYISSFTPQHLFTKIVADFQAAYVFFVLSHIWVGLADRGGLERQSEFWSLKERKLQPILTPSLRRPCIHAIFFPTACRTACKYAFCFLRVRPEAVSTRHSWLWQTLDDVYTRRCFSES